MQPMLLLVTKNIQGRMTLLELRRENACPRVSASGYTGGDIRGANATDSFVSTRLPICERGLDYRQGEKERSENMCCDWSTILWGCLLGLLAVLSKCRGAMSCGWLATAHTTFIVCFKIHLCCAVEQKCSVTGERVSADTGLWTWHCQR